MAYLMCLSTFIIGLFKQNLGYLAVSVGFAIADAISDFAASRVVDED